MTSQAIRAPLAEHLITPQNAAFVLIDYQPSQFATVRSMDEALLRKNIVSTVKTAKAFAVPIVHSTVNVASGQQQPTVPELAELLEDSPPLDRTTVNSWEDTEFVEAVHATGRRKLICCALWTEVCMAFTALDALRREGYEPDFYWEGSNEDGNAAGGINPPRWSSRFAIVDEMDVIPGAQERGAFAGVLPRLYWDTASAFSDPVLHMLRSVTGLGKVMFGTDYPYPRDAISIGGLRQLENTAELDDGERRGVLGGSAVRLIPRLARVESTL